MESWSCFQKHLNVQFKLSCLLKLKEEIKMKKGERMQTGEQSLNALEFDLSVDDFVNLEVN